MPIILQNDTASTLRVGVAAGDTTLVVASGQGSRFPTLGVGDYFYATLEGTAGDKEIVQITARSGDSLTAVRGAESTTAREFPAGSTIEMRVTAASVIDAAANAVSLSALGVTASAAELNVLDGITASTAELNRMDGVTWTLTDYNTLTATVLELNLLDGVTWILTDYNTLTTSAAELNVLDGITASTAELNLLDGVTWTLTDYNTLTATAAELNALDGVTTAGVNIVRAADAAAQRTVLGLGDIATTDLIDEDDFASDTAARAPTQQSVKAYVDLRLPISPDYDSGNLSWTNGAAITPLTHGLGGIPSRIEAYLICKVIDGNYAVGDRIKVGDYFSNSNDIYGMTIASNTTQIKGVVGASGLVFHDASIAGPVTASTTNWDLRIYAWK